MAVTLLALFRTPGGDADALEAFIGRYQAEHVPLIAQVPGLRSQHVQRVTKTYTDSDLVIANHMTFDDRAAVETAMASDAMRVAGRNLRDIAPGLLTLIVLEDEEPLWDSRAGSSERSAK
jgi:uncharacterized protein (TIGR02118 family)